MGASWIMVTVFGVVLAFLERLSFLMVSRKESYVDEGEFEGVVQAGLSSPEPSRSGCCRRP